MAEETKENIYSIPLNYRTPGKWKTFRIRNVMEGLIAFALVAVLVKSIPRLRWQIRIGMTLLFGGGLGILFSVGIGGRSLTGFLIDYIRFVYTKKKYHFPKIGVIYGKAVENRKNSAGSVRESKLERLLGERKVGKAASRPEGRSRI